MEQNLNKFIAVSYQLFTVNEGKTELVEEATAEQPYQFISGFGLTLDKFENAIAGLQQGETFDLSLSPEEAYGDFEQAHVLDLDKSIFTIDGKFDEENICEGGIVPLQNEDGTRFTGTILKITDQTVTVDLNHPLAGKSLNFKGQVIESREATNDEIAAMVNQISGGGCGCGGGCGDGGCGGGCHHDSDACGCGNS